MLPAILAALPGLIPILLPKLVPELTVVVDKYLNKQITADQLNAQVEQAILNAFGQISAAELDSLTKTYTAFVTAASQNKTMARAWATVVYVELAVVVWFQVGVPAVVYFFDKPWPPSGNTADWAYGLLALSLGGGAVTLRPLGGASLLDKLKSIIKKP